MALRFRGRTAVAGYLLLAVLFLLFALSRRPERIPRDRTYDRIIQSGRIEVITRNNAHCYYHYRGQEMGFEYELAQAFAAFLGVDLQIRIGRKWDRMIPDLTAGQGDLIAASVTITPDRESMVAFSNGYLAIQQHIIVHRENLDIKSEADLSGKSVHVRRGTTYEAQLARLRASGVDVTPVIYDNISTEELIRQVAEKEIEVTIADSNIAMLNRRYHPQAVMAAPISEREHLGWAVSANAHRLLKQIDRFFRTIKENGTFGEIYERYYSDVEIFDYIDLKAYHDRLETRLPKYLDIIKDAAGRHGFDWRMIAAQIYQESHFEPDARSHAGAHGLMQLTRRTARKMGVRDLFDPEENIRGGTRYLKKLYNFFDRAEGEDRLFIALAAYNVGQGHVFDARNIARDRGLDPNRWAVLSTTLPLLAKEAYHRHAKYGYCRGTQPVEYVSRILLYFDILKRRGIEYRFPPGFGREG